MNFGSDIAAGVAARLARLLLLLITVAAALGAGIEWLLHRYL